ncbi:MAG: hypothetical protein SV775_04425 [Thermodesulfobacteriota bacterium]|nr:hypothetical protein [Thermodesulfobacteriota bacterium]
MRKRNVRTVTTARCVVRIDAVFAVRAITEKHIPNWEQALLIVNIWSGREVKYCPPPINAQGRRAANTPSVSAESPMQKRIR